MGRSTGSRNVRSRAKTRVMKTPSGLVTAKINARNTRICSHPFKVISEFLRTQQRVEQIDSYQRADDEHNERLRVQGFLLLHAIAETHVCDCRCEKCDRNCDPQNVLHGQAPRAKFMNRVAEIR